MIRHQNFENRTEIEEVMEIPNFDSLMLMELHASA